jgi:transposase
MTTIHSPLPGYEVFSDAEFFTHDHLPAAAAYCRKLGLVELIDHLVPSQMHLRPGLAVQAMVLDTLSGRTPLYRMEEFMGSCDRELLLGEEVAPHLFSDNSLGRSLDAIFEVGSSKILTEIGVRATKIFALDPTSVSYDTTSTNVWGDYRHCEEDEPPKGPVITHGHSKDHRPDLKQFMTELLCVERGVPIFGRTLDGNSSDKTSNNGILTNISSIMARHGLGAGAFVYIADSALVTGNNLSIIGDTTRFVSRLPASYSACSKAVTEAVKADEWTKIGRLSENPGSKNRPGACYKGFETTVELHGRTYRAAVIHSDSHDKRRQKKLQKDLLKSKNELAEKLKKTTTTYHCEADAKDAAQKIAGTSTALHHIESEVLPFQTRRPGRPPKNGSAPTQTKYELTCTIVEDTQAVTTRREEAGCFVLISNVPTEGTDALITRELLRVYKGQYGVENDFAFLKDPLIVNDTFLKSPHRIDALGMILVIALLIWRLMERSMRNWVKDTGETLPGWDRKKTVKPTTFMMTTLMHGIQVLLTKARKRCFLRDPTTRQIAFLQAMGLSKSVFIDPRCVCKVIIYKKSKEKG